MKNGHSDDPNGHALSTSPIVKPVRFVKGDQHFKVKLQFAQEGTDFTGLCLELGIGAFGDDLKEARAALVEAIILQLEAHEDEGDLKEYLGRNGVRLVRQRNGPQWNPVDPALAHA